jgi:hypothetical protein
VSDASPADTLASPAPLEGPAVPEIARDLLLTAKAFRSSTRVLLARMNAVAHGPEDLDPKEVVDLDALEAMSSAWTTTMNGIQRLEACMRATNGAVEKIHGKASAVSAKHLGRDEAAESCECPDCGPRRAKAVGDALAIAAKAGRS